MPAPPGSGNAMSPDAILAVQKILDFCNEKWIEADRATDQTADLKTGRKIGYNHVIHYARKLLDDGADSGKNHP
jgi:hypothetical protein